jgi:hypothetical protein
LLGTGDYCWTNYTNSGRKDAMTFMTLRITERALVQRINRRLAKVGERVRKTRVGTRSEVELGTFFITDCDRNCVQAKDVDVEALGHELGVLAPCELVEGQVTV